MERRPVCCLYALLSLQVKRPLRSQVSLPLVDRLRFTRKCCGAVSADLSDFIFIIIGGLLLTACGAGLLFGSEAGPAPSPLCSDIFLVHADTLLDLSDRLCFVATLPGSFLAQAGSTLSPTPEVMRCSMHAVFLLGKLLLCVLHEQACDRLPALSHGVTLQAICLPELHILLFRTLGPLLCSICRHLQSQPSVRRTIIDVPIGRTS
mmetsp:Transcript_30553/g.55652  ORF Transcript_30553/g.55652 Transcript_30553/m.55652 type:complete len:206 (+) Transcript_30553:1072-1689(+)